jgi:hypothetical protein
MPTLPSGPFRFFLSPVRFQPPLSSIGPPVQKRRGRASAYFSICWNDTRPRWRSVGARRPEIFCQGWVLSLTGQSTYSPVSSGRGASIAPRSHRATWRDIARLVRNTVWSLEPHTGSNREWAANPAADVKEVPDGAPRFRASTFCSGVRSASFLKYLLDCPLWTARCSRCRRPRSRAVIFCLTNTLASAVSPILQRTPMPREAGRMPIGWQFLPLPH